MSYYPIDRSIPLTKHMQARIGYLGFTITLETVNGEDIIYPDQLDHMIGILLELKNVLARYSNPIERSNLDQFREFADLSEWI
jgi:hypothetical protein